MQYIEHCYSKPMPCGLCTSDLRIYNTNYLVSTIFVFIVGIAGLNKLKAIMGTPHQQSSSTFKRNQDKFFLENDIQLLNQQVSRSRRQEIGQLGEDPDVVWVAGMPITTASGAKLGNKFG